MKIVVRNNPSSMDVMMRLALPLIFFYLDHLLWAIFCFMGPLSTSGLFFFDYTLWVSFLFRIWSLFQFLVFDLFGVFCFLLEFNSYKFSFTKPLSTVYLSNCLVQLISLTSLAGLCHTDTVRHITYKKYSTFRIFHFLFCSSFIL